MEQIKDKYSEIIQIKVLPEHKQNINKAINQTDKYLSLSHFVRCAIIKLLREELQNGKTKNNV